MKGVGGTQQTRYRDFVILRHDLQADRVEHHCHHHRTQRNAEEQQHQPQYAQQCCQAFYPGRIDLHGVDAGQRFEFAGDIVNPTGIHRILETGQLEHVAVGQWIGTERGEHIIEAGLALERVKGFFTRREFDLGGAVAVLQNGADGGGQCHRLVARRIHFQEQADFRFDRQLLGYGADVFEYGQSGKWQCQRNRHHQYVEDEVAGRAQQMGEGIGAGKESVDAASSCAHLHRVADAVMPAIDDAAAVEINDAVGTGKVLLIMGRDQAGDADAVK